LSGINTRKRGGQTDRRPLGSWRDRMCVRSRC